MSKSSIAVIVLNWNDADLLPKSVGSLLKQSEKCDIILVDNASMDDSRVVIESFGSKVTALWNTKNKGFAGGVNTGIRYALDREYEFIALLNNDAVADKDWLKNLRKGFTRENIGAATCSLIHKDRKNYDSTGEIYTTWGLAYPRGRGESVKGQFNEMINITAVSGGASMFRASFFQDVGLFDEDFFAYYEDVDLGLRGQLRGWIFNFVPEAKAFHATGTTSGRIAGFNTYQQVKNQPLLFIKNVPTRLLPIMLPRFLLAYLSIIFGNISQGSTRAVMKGMLGSALYTPKKILQRFSIQRARTISPQEFATRIIHDIPPSNKRLRTLRDSLYRRLQQKRRDDSFSIGVDGTPFFRPVDGIGRYSSNLIATIAKQHPKVSFTIIGFRGDSPNKELTNSLPGSVKFFYIPLPRRLYQGIFSKIIPVNLRFLLPKFNHVIHLNFTLFPYIKYPAATSTLFVHDTTFIDMPEVVTLKNLTYLQKRVPWSMKRTTGIATISEFTKIRINDIYNYPVEKIRMIGTGVDTTHFRQFSKPKNLPPQYILAIGTLEPRKNLESLIKAYLKLPQRLQEQYSLVIGGSSGWKNERLMNLISSSDHIVHLGYVEDKDLPGLYQYASLFVFPSLYEGFGIPILEAMANKVQVLANDLNLFHSIGQSHINYVDARNLPAFTRSIKRQLENPLSKNRLVGAQKHAQKYNWEDSAERLWAVIMQGRTMV